MGRKQKLKKERKAATAAESIKLLQRGDLFWTAFIGLCILMIYPPFFRGLFFSKEFLPTHAFSALLFSLWWIHKLSVKKDKAFLIHPLDYAVLGLVTAYAVSLIPAVNTRAALGELLKNINYFMAFWMAAEATREIRKPQLLLNVLLASAALVALLGIGAAAGTFDYPGAFMGGRIYSSFQYPNTLATYVTAAFFISMTLLLDCQYKWGKYIYSSINFTMLFVLIFTYSRGAWLVFPLIFGMYLIGLSKGKRAAAVVQFIQAVVPVILCLQGFSAAISGGMQLKAWFWYLTGIALTIALAVLSDLLIKRIPRLNKKTIIAAVGVCFAAFAAVAGTFYRLIPQSILERLSRISLEQSSAGARLEFYRDAFKIIKDYPIFGAGGGGWKSLYQGYQSRLYWTTEVHSYFLQVWVESGTLGFIALIAVCVILAYEMYKLLTAKEIDTSVRNHIWAAFVGAFAIGVHSLIDFNLSLGAVALFLWFLIGVVRGGISYIKEGTDTRAEPGRRYSSAGAFVTAMSVLVIVVSFSLLIGEIKAERANKYLAEGNIQKGIDAYDAATRFDPFNSEYRIQKALVLEFAGEETGDVSFMDKAEEEYRKALKYDGYNAKNYSAAGFFYLKTGQAEKGFKCIDKAIELHPYLIDYYEEKAFAYKDLVKFLIENKNPEEAAKYIQSTLEIANDIRLVNEKSQRPIEMTYSLLTDLEKLAFMGNDIGNRKVHRLADRIVFATTQMFDTAEDNVPDFWRMSNSEGGSIDTRIIEEDGERMLRLENSGNDLGYIYTRDFALQPDEWYLLTFKARGNVNPVNFRVYIRSRSGERTQGAITSVEVSEEWQEYELEVLTTKDIEPGNQYIRIDHRGNDTGYVEIKDIVLREW